MSTVGGVPFFDQFNESAVQLLYRAGGLEYPQEWRRSLIVPVFKDGDREELDNYRGIVLSCVVGKVFERVLDEGIRAVSEEMVMKEVQGGFTKGRGCADQIFVLRSVVELRKKQGLKTVIAFLDVRKAYDTVWREGLWKKMRGYSIAERLVKWCELFYNRDEAAECNRALDDAVV